jgi:hypothetical protein
MHRTRIADAGQLFVVGFIRERDSLDQGHSQGVNFRNRDRQGSTGSLATSSFDPHAPSAKSARYNWRAESVTVPGVDAGDVQ